MRDIVRRLRLRAGLTQAELAGRAGTSQSAVAAYESEAKSPTLRTLERLAVAASAELVVRPVVPMSREDRRSLAWHRAVVRHLEEHPERTLSLARRNLERWSASGSGGQALRERWTRWLELPPPDLVVLVLDPGAVGREMRQVSPFAGALSAAERARVIRAFRRDEAA